MLYHMCPTSSHSLSTSSHCHLCPIPFHLRPLNNVHAQHLLLLPKSPFKFPTHSTICAHPLFICALISPICAKTLFIHIISHFFHAGCDYAHACKYAFDHAYMLWGDCISPCFLLLASISHLKHLVLQLHCSCLLRTLLARLRAWSMILKVTI